MKTPHKRTIFRGALNVVLDRQLGACIEFAMKYNGIIQRKLALLDKQYILLQTHTKDVAFAQFENDWVLRSMAERALQVMVEIMIDISERIIAMENAGPVSSASEAIELLVKLNILKSAEPYSSMVKFRNLIVHQYEEIDPNILYDIIKNKMLHFRQFRDEIDQA